jgi:mannan endo-1,4-beta-mannosidase
MLLAVDPSTKSKVSDVFQQAASVGLTVGRTWAFNDGGWRALQKSPGVYDEDVFKALDFVISEAQKNGIRLILSLSNNWDAFGGKSQYLKWGNSAGLDLSSEDAFFSHATLKAYFKDHIKNVLRRVNTVTNVTYKDDPTIFAWELMNEPRCLSDASGDTLQEWIQEMAFYVKSIDPKHLLEIGVEGFYGPSSPDRVVYNPNSFAQQVGTDFVRNHQALGIDFASVHIYPDNWISSSISAAHLSFVKNWTTSHIRDCEKTLKMPVMFAEFGTSSRDPGYNSSYRDTFIQTVYESIIASARKGGGGAGSLIWQLFPEGVEQLNDGYEVVLSKSPSTAEVLRAQSVALWELSSMCRWSFRWSCRREIVNTPRFSLLNGDSLVAWPDPVNEL